MDNLNFFKIFRLRKATVLNVLEQIENELKFPDDKNNSISPINQLLTCLRFYATGNHLSSIADFMGMHTATVSRIVGKVSRVLAQLSGRYIRMPENEEIISVQNRFFKIASFPRVLGCIDGSHIRIQSPGGEDAEVFRNRKGYFAMNIQTVGDADLRIRDIVARWPGSTHDQTIFINSRIKTRFENGEFPNSLHLGDSGYALKNYLLTPLAEPRTEPENIYNEADIRTRNTIERLFGMFKRRFPVLAYGIRLNIPTTLAVITAAAVLHNIVQEMNEDEPPMEEQHLEEIHYLIEMGNVPDIIYNGNEDERSYIFRNNILDYYANLH